MSATTKRADEVRVGDILAGGLVVVENGIGIGENPYVELHYYIPRFKRVHCERLKLDDAVEVQP